MGGEAEDVAKGSARRHAYQPGVQLPGGPRDHGQPVLEAGYANGAMLFAQSSGGVRIVSGYALSVDGLWRQHYWGVDAGDGRVIETTERRVRYYGFVLDHAESALRLLALMGTGDRRPEELMEVREVLPEVFQLPAALVDFVGRQDLGRRGRIEHASGDNICLAFPESCSGSEASRPASC